MKRNRFDPIVCASFSERCPLVSDPLSIATLREIESDSCAELHSSSAAFPAHSARMIEDDEDQRMDAKRIKETRKRLSSEYEKLIHSIGRNRIAAEQIQVENTEDEGDLAAISHDRDLLYNLHEGGFARLRFIQEALKAIDRGQYGECVGC